MSNGEAPENVAMHRSFETIEVPSASSLLPTKKNIVCEEVFQDYVIREQGHVLFKISSIVEIHLCTTI